jgi:hypothetical protein
VKRTSAASVTSVPATQSQRSTPSYRAERWSTAAGNSAAASTCGTCRLPGIVVRDSNQAARAHPAASTTAAAQTARLSKVDPLATRVAVISDVHANWHALEAVLEEIEREEPDELWCLGDLVGYGPRPNRCCAAVERRSAVCLAGNHDLGVLGTIDLDEFTGDAVVAASWTRGVLAEGSRAFLESLSSSGAREGVELFHASPRDPVWEYVRSSLSVTATCR